MWVFRQFVCASLNDCCLSTAASGCEGAVVSHSNMDVMMPVASPMSAMAVSEQHQGACMISGT